MDVLTQGSLEPIYGSRIDNPPVFTINDLTQIDEAALRKPVSTLARQPEYEHGWCG